MKKHVKRFTEWGKWFVVAFTIAVLIYTGIAAIMGEKTMQITLVWQLLAIAMLSTLLQMVAFSGWVIKSMRYSRRVLLFGVSFLLVLSAFAYGFGWFPTAYFSAWLLFVGAFLVILVITTLAFDVYFKASGKELNRKLGLYKEKTQGTEER